MAITPTYAPHYVSGTSSSRLSEVRKFTVSQIFTEMYVVYDGTNDGVDYINSNPDEKIIYYIGDIKYVDTIVGGVTTGTKSYFTTIGTDDPQFMSAPIYKSPTKENIVGDPKTNNDVFIIRQELSAFDGNYKLEFIENLTQLTTYAGGNFFNIVNNT